MKRFYNTFKVNTSISCDETYESESLEEKLRKVTLSNEPIDSTAPIIYTPRKDGVRAEMDIRTDRFEIAQQAMDKVTKSMIARRENVGEKTSIETPVTD